MAAQDAFPVVAAVDGSRTGLATVDLAVVEAVRRRSPLLIAHVSVGRHASTFRHRATSLSDADRRHLLDISARRAQLAAPDLRIDTELFDGGAAYMLTRLSERAQLLVVGHRDESAARTGWGSTAAYLAHHSACPVLVYRGAVPRQGPVVVAVSARPTAAATVGRAFAEADARRSRLVAVHVWVPAAVDDAGREDGAGDGDMAAARQATELALAEALAGWCTRFPDVPVERLLVQDSDIAYTIDRASRRGSLLIAGMGHRGWFPELLYGSMSLGATPHASCPVLLLPPAWTMASGAPRRALPSVRIRPDPTTISG